MPRPVAGIRPEFAAHVPYAIAQDRTYRAVYYRWECPCGEVGVWVADQERAHDEHREHVAAQLRRCPLCLTPLTLELDSTAEAVDAPAELVCADHGVQAKVDARSLGPVV